MKPAHQAARPPPRGGQLGEVIGQLMAPAPESPADGAMPEEAGQLAATLDDSCAGLLISHVDFCLITYFLLMGFPCEDDAS